MSDFDTTPINMIIFNLFHWL